jgi:hypothetical protein
LGFLDDDDSRRARRRRERYVQRLAVETTCRWHLWEVREFYFVLIMKSHLSNSLSLEAYDVVPLLHLD